MPAPNVTLRYLCSQELTTELIGPRLPICQDGARHWRGSGRPKGDIVGTEAATATTWKLFIGGEDVAAEDGREFENRDPFTGEVVGMVAAGSRDDTRRAIEAASEAAPAWAQTAPGARQAIFLRA